MKNIVLISLGFGLSFLFGFTLNNSDKSKATKESESALAGDKIEDLKLGAFSMSLNVKDLKVSKAYYEKLGFEVLGGKEEHRYLIMKNDNALIGLFQGFFENNILTFNPGWDENGKDVEDFNDIRLIQEHLKEEGIKIEKEIDVETNGPASLILEDPDGNVIFLDQHRSAK